MNKAHAATQSPIHCGFRSTFSKQLAHFLTFLSAYSTVQHRQSITRLKAIHPRSRAKSLRHNESGCTYMNLPKLPSTGTTFVYSKMGWLSETFFDSLRARGGMSIYYRLLESDADSGCKSLLSTGCLFGTHQHHSWRYEAHRLDQFSRCRPGAEWFAVQLLERTGTRVR